MGKLKYDSELPSIFYSAVAQHELAMNLLKKAQDLEFKIQENNTSIEIAYRRLEKASEIYRTLEQIMFFGDYCKLYSIKEIEEVYNGLKRTTIYDYEPLCFIRE
jgi:hypothetical protein